MNALRSAWTPAGLLTVGAFMSLGVGQQQEMELRAPLAMALPDSVAGMAGAAVEISEAEAAAAAFTDYALQVYESEELTEDGEPLQWASVYLGFYDSQTQGRTIHSPRNCLPGSGWEALDSGTATLPVDTPVTVNRYLLQNGEVRALVLYWYQGRGRVAHNEYLVKWDLLRDAALRRRTDEALVRVVVPIRDSEEEALALATSLATRLQPAVDRVLPQ
ncbi:MAG: EpsI family protein [Longimicrobiales bacterium]